MQWKSTNLKITFLRKIISIPYNDSLPDIISRLSLAIYGPRDLDEPYSSCRSIMLYMKEKINQLIFTVLSNRVEKLNGRFYTETSLNQNKLKEN